MTDYFKQAFPDGMSYERSFLFEDGGVATASWNIRYNCNFFMTFREHFKKKLNIQEYFWRGAGSSYFKSDI